MNYEEYTGNVLVTKPLGGRKWNGKKRREDREETTM